MDSYSDEKNPDNGCEPTTPIFYMEPTETDEYLEFVAKYPRKKQICICGHTINAHTFSSSGFYNCYPGRITCYCRRPQPVYVASDARCFNRSTHGFGVKHALGFGIADLEKKGGHGEWLVPLKCRFEDCLESKITVVCIDKTGRVVPKSTETSLLFCNRHALEYGGMRF